MGGGLAWVKNRLRVVKSWPAIKGELEREKLWIKLQSLTISSTKVVWHGIGLSNRWWVERVSMCNECSFRWCLRLADTLASKSPEMTTHLQCGITADSGLKKFVKQGCSRSSIYYGNEYSVSCVLQLSYMKFRLIFKSESASWRRKRQAFEFPKFAREKRYATAAHASTVVSV